MPLTTPINQSKQKLLQFLLEKKSISIEKIQSLIDEAVKTHVDPEELLVKRGLLSLKDLAAAKGELYGLPFIDLEKEKVPFEILSTIPQTVAEHYSLVLFEKKEKDVKIALVDPSDFRALESIDFWAKSEGYKTKLYITTLTGYRNVLRGYTEFKHEVATALKTLESETRTVDKRPKLSEIIRKAPVAQIVASIIQEAVSVGTSDIHIEPAQDESRIRFRIDGVLRTFLTLSATHHSNIVARIKVLAQLKIDETRIPQDGRIRFKAYGEDVNLRVSTLPMLGTNEKVVMRILPTTEKVFTPEELGFWQHPLDALKKIMERPSGVVLVSGPTGSGKSTTLFAVLSALNKESVNITTLEDPVEYFMKGVNQIQINTEVGLTFAGGLRAILRQDPNIVMVGEIRDRETAELATQAALTGHFMLSTIHAKDVLGVIPRLIDMGVEPFLIAASLNTIFAQRLVRKLCQECKKPADLPDHLEKEFRAEVEAITSKDILIDVPFGATLQFYRPGGCDKCNKSGYKGRTVVSEVLGMTPQLEELMGRKFSVDELQREMRRQGHVTFKQDAILKGLKGLTSIEEILRISRGD